MTKADGWLDNSTRDNTDNREKAPLNQKTRRRLMAFSRVVWVHCCYASCTTLGMSEMKLQENIVCGKCFWKTLFHKADKLKSNRERYGEKEDKIKVK